VRVRGHAKVFGQLMFALLALTVDQISRRAVLGDGAGDDEGGDHAALCEPGDEGGCVPVAVRDGHAQAFAARGPSMGAVPVGLGPGLVDEDWPVGVEAGLAVAPGAPALPRGRSFFTRDTRKRCIDP